MLLTDIQNAVTVSLKKGDAVSVETLRFLISAAKNAAITKYGAEADTKITDADVLDVIKKQVKTHRESVEAFTKAGRTELAAREAAQLSILESYLPSQISDEELERLLMPVVSEGGDFGPMMGKAMKAVGGKADGGRVSALLRRMTASK